MGIDVSAHRWRHSRTEDGVREYMVDCTWPNFGHSTQQQQSAGMSDADKQHAGTQTSNGAHQQSTKIVEVHEPTI